MDGAHHPGVGSGYQTLCALQREIGGISQKMLTQTLRSSNAMVLCSAESIQLFRQGGVLSDTPGPHFDRAVACPVSLVGKHLSELQANLPERPLKKQRAMKCWRSGMINNHI